MIEFAKLPEKIESFLPPTIIAGRKEEGCNWAVIDGKWYPVPTTLTFEQLRSAWVKGNPRQTKPTADRWVIKGSKGDEYLVEYKGGQWKCDCLGFGWRRGCKHVETVKKSLK
jgi:hypothetical protein